MKNKREITQADYLLEQGLEVVNDLIKDLDIIFGLEVNDKNKEHIDLIIMRARKMSTRLSQLYNYAKGLEYKS